MCGRYTMLADQMKVKQRFGLTEDIPGVEKSYNIAPGQQILAVIHDGKKRRAGYLRWGLVPFWAHDKKIGYKMINARSETIHQKPSFKHLLGRKHCLIVADSFMNGKKRKTLNKPNVFLLNKRVCLLLQVFGKSGSIKERRYSLVLF